MLVCAPHGTCYLKRPEEGMGSPGTRVADGMSPHVGAGKGASSLAGAASEFIHRGRLSSLVRTLSLLSPSFCLPLSLLFFFFFLSYQGGLKLTL